MNKYYRHKDGELAEIVFSDDTCVQYRKVGGSGIVMTDVRSIFHTYFEAVPEAAEPQYTATIGEDGEYELRRDGKQVGTINYYQDADHIVRALAAPAAVPDEDFHAMLERYLAWYSSAQTVEHHRNAKACIASLIRSASGVPAGWKLVPLEPTEAMVIAAREVEHCDEGITTGMLRAAIAAAPTTAAATQQQERPKYDWCPECHARESMPPAADSASPATPKVTIALPDYEERRLVLASVEWCDDELLVCAAIDDSAARAMPEEGSHA